MIFWPLAWLCRTHMMKTLKSSYKTSLEKKKKKINTQEKKMERKPVLFFAYDYLNNPVVYLVDLCRDRAHVIGHSWFVDCP